MNIKVEKYVKQNKWFIIGFVLITFFVFSNYLYGYKISFTNVNYSFAPFDSTDTETDGPLLSDIADSMYPAIYSSYYSEESASFWESDVALGRSNNIIAEYMNPMNWVYLMPLGLAVFLKYFSEFAIAFFSMYLFMKGIGVKRYSAALTGVIYAFSAVIVVWLGWSHSDVAAWAPLLFFAVEKMISTIKAKYMFLSALVVYIMLMVGMPTYAAYFLYLVGIYIVIFTLKHHWNNKKNIFVVWGMFAVSVILAALASLPYTYTLLESVGANGYSDSRAGYATAVLDWKYLRTFLLPYVREGMSAHMNESTLYVGIITVILLPFAFVNNKKKKRNIFFLLSSFVIITLIFTNIFDFVFTKLPMINTSLKYRVITLLMFTLAVVIGNSLNDFWANREYYIKRKWLMGIVIVWTVGILCIATRGLWEPYTKEVVKTVVLSVALIACVVLLLKREYKPIYFAFMFLVVLDSALFVKGYLPWIEATADIIPEPTDSVSYLIENTEEEERIVGVGMWTLFPNTSSYYELNDIRIHGFEATNDDMKKVYTTIAEDAYDTNTRVSFKQINNYELLKYLGVKYVYGPTLNNVTTIGNDIDSSKVFGIIPSDTTLSQNIYLQENPRVISILFATYDKVPQSNGTLTMTLVSASDNRVVYEKNVSVNQICDNSYLSFFIDKEVYVAEGDYKIKLTFGDIKDDTITVWMKEQEGSSVTSEEFEMSGAMVMQAEYDSNEYQIVYSGADNILIAEIDEYANKVELVEKVFVCETEEDVLNAMSEEYIDNAIFIVDEDASECYDISITENEEIEVVEYNDDYVKILCTTEYERYVTLNDYFDEDWSVYVNGEEADVEKVNYLMRAVKVSEGQDIVIEFVYEPDILYTITTFSLSVIVLTMIMYVFRRRLQLMVDKLVV